MHMIRKALTGSAVVVTSAVSVLSFGGIAHADPTAPPWEPDTNSQAPYGTLAFYDASGAQVTSGTNLDQLFSYTQGSTILAPAGVNKSTLYFAAPNHALPTGQWFDSQESLSTSNPDTTAPGGLATSLDPVTDETTEVGAADLNGFLGKATLDSTPGYANIIQARVLTTQSRSNNGSAPNYWDADIAYNPASATSSIVVDGVTLAPGSWAEVYGTFPAPPSSTPEAPLAIGLPLAGLGLIGFGVVFARRRHSDTTTA